MPIFQVPTRLADVSTGARSVTSSTINCRTHTSRIPFSWDGRIPRQLEAREEGKKRCLASAKLHFWVIAKLCVSFPWVPSVLFLATPRSLLETSPDSPPSPLLSPAVQANGCIRPRTRRKISPKTHLAQSRSRALWILR